MNAQHHRFLQSTEARSLDDRRVELSFSSEEPVLRSYGYEVLDHSPGAADLSRLAAAAPLLADHDAASQIGVVERAWIDQAARKGRAVVRFSSSARASEFLVDVRDGIRQNVSFGYTTSEAVQAGTRDGEPIFRITRWQPFEISIVSVPADVTVGVGRSLPAVGVATRSAAVASPTRPDSLSARLAASVGERVSPMNLLQARAGERPRAGQEPMPFSLSLTDTYVPGRNPGRPVEASWHRLAESVLVGSRVLQAGVGLVVWHEDAARVQVYGRVGLQTRPGAMRVVEPAEFSTIAETAAFATAAASPSVVDATSFPWSEAPIAFDDGSHVRKAFSIVLTHADRRDVASLFESISQAIVAGLSRAADEALLSAIDDSTPAAFTLAAAAAAGRSFQELRAVVGTAGTGAAVDASGALRCGLVPAELTSETAKSFVFAPSRLAVVLHERVDVLISAPARNGEITVTVWADLLPLIPSAATSVWEVA